MLTKNPDFIVLIPCRNFISVEKVVFKKCKIDIGKVYRFLNIIKCYITCSLYGKKRVLNDKRDYGDSLSSGSE